MIENIVGKGENAGHQHFLLFPQCFQNASFQGSLKVRILWKRVKAMRRLKTSRICTTLLHYGSFPFTFVVGSESRPSSCGIYVT